MLVDICYSTDQEMPPGVNSLSKIEVVHIAHTMFLRLLSSLPCHTLEITFSFQTNFRCIIITLAISVIMTFLYLMGLPDPATTQLIMNL